MTVYESSPAAAQNIGLVAPGRLEDWHRLNQTFAGVSGRYGENVTDTSGIEPERLERAARPAALFHGPWDLAIAVAAPAMKAARVAPVDALRGE